MCADVLEENVFKVGHILVIERRRERLGVVLDIIIYLVLQWSMLCLWQIFFL